jgi:hypothetical protein
MCAVLGGETCSAVQHQPRLRKLPHNNHSVCTRSKASMLWRSVISPCTTTFHRLWPALKALEPVLTCARGIHSVCMLSGRTVNKGQYGVSRPLVGLRHQLSGRSVHQDACGSQGVMRLECFKNMTIQSPAETEQNITQVCKTYSSSSELSMASGLPVVCPPWTCMQVNSSN